MPNGRRRADSDKPSVEDSSSPPRSKARLPVHFASAFEYAGESRAGSSPKTSSLVVPATITTPTSDQDISLRRSSRIRQSRYADLQNILTNDSDHEPTQQRQASSSSLKKAEAPKVGSDNFYDQGLPKKNGTKKPRKRIRRTRDDPTSAAGSIYAHLKGLPDLFAPHNDIMFCGINPGVKSSQSGHHFAHRSNHFYPSLHLAAITEQRMKPEQDVEFPYLQPLSLGLTNLAHRPTAEGNELLPGELIVGVPILLEKIRKWKPKTVCFVGKGISEAFLKGLKQVGAIDKGKTPGQRQTSGSTFKRSDSFNGPGSSIKAEDHEAVSALGPVKAEGSESVGRRLLTASIPSSILCAHPAAPSDDRVFNSPSRASPSKKTPPSPEKPKKQLYTKANSKDDSGYGILSLCVPHTKGYHDALSLDDVTLFFVTPSSSARVTTHFLDDKARILSSLRTLALHLQHISLDQKSGGVKLEEKVSFADTWTVELEVIDVTRYDI